MSWGFFIDLDLTLPTARWRQLATTTAADHAVSPGWFGLKDRELEETYLDSEFDDTKLAEALTFFEGEGSLCEVHEGNGTTILRVCQLVDRGSDTGIVKPIAAIFEGAKDVATGHIQLVNDGSYSGEDGAILTALNGTVTRKRLKDCNPIVAKLAAATFGDLDELMATFSPNAPTKRKPAAKVAKKSAKKSTAKKSATKKPATKKPAKKSAKKQPAAKQPARRR